MKILLISFSTRGAIGDYFFLLSRELARKVNLNILVPNYFDKKINNIEIFKFTAGKNKIITFLNFLNPLNIFRILNFIRKTGPDLVHLFFGEGYPPAIILAFYLKIKKIPLLVTLHDPEIHPGNFIEKLNGILRKITLCFSSAVHIHSKVFVKNVKKLGIKENKIFIIPHGSFSPLFEKYKKISNKEEKNIILFFGRLEKYKGIEYFVEAGLKLKGKFKFVIAGPGKLSKNLREKIEKNKEIFELHNYFLREEEIAELFNRARVCVLPYIQATQSAIPLISAFFKVPVVATKIGAFIEDISRVNGILVEPKNSDALAEGILKALNQKVYYPKELEFPSLANKFLAMYKEVLKEFRSNKFSNNSL